MSTTTVDRIEKQALLPATRARVWRALTDWEEFCDWFEVDFSGPFREGARMRGQVTHPGFEHLEIDLTVEAIEPERRFAFRWHPDTIDPDKDYSKEPTTLVEFFLEDEPDGTCLRVVESGFERIPGERRAIAIESNARGWTEQLGNIRRHLLAHPDAK